MKAVSGQLSVVRRSFFCFALGALLLALCFSAEAQQPAKIPRIGYVSGGNPNDPLEAAFGQALRDLGYVDGKNILIEYRYQEGKAERGPILVAELVKLKVDVLVLNLQLRYARPSRRPKRFPLSWRQQPIRSHPSLSIAWLVQVEILPG